MKLKDGVILAGLNPVMRQALIKSEEIWIYLGREEGVTITSGLDGCHSAGSYHYYGLAIDLRIKYFNEDQKADAFRLLVQSLSRSGFDVVMHSTHIHIEYDLFKSQENKNG
jgi:hypothetical protein